ncbi:FG-GAP-like repeat-containing protein [Pseudoalteromonas sp.]|uniref:FG-GAP-like repeat-containing protein n=1 Tax=Pseudoalteromonas sp. TaxID=53249 RepID=UPI001BCB2279|nr:FG-GAP-like repeat-containing protein [Pseudoalteromonas sp.]
MFNKKGLWTIFLGLVSWSVIASSVTPTNNIWQDSNGDLYYQQPVKQVTTIDEAPVSIRLFESMPYVRIIETADGYQLVPMSKSEFMKLSNELDVVGKRLRSDFDGDGIPDILIQTDLGHELLVSNKTVKPFKIGIDIRSFGNEIEIRDVNYDFRADIVNKDTQEVYYAQAAGLTHAINTNDYVGTIAAESSVTPSGEFTYNIPITLGEATGGLKPSVSLSYSSTPRNGHVGVGFNIGGLSAITRCEKNMETDGVASSVNLDKDDMFCLDSQRLILKTGQTYGANNTEYRTRQNNGQKIVAHTTNTTTGPYAFTVYDTQGNKYTYGKYSSSQDALIKATNGRGFAWALKRVEDASGNYYSYNYGSVSGSLEYYPLSIKYSGYGATTRNEVRFNWQTRADTSRVTYLKGNKITLTKRLQNVESYYSGNLIRRYNLTYGYIGTGVTESVLQQVQACSNDNKCLSPTIFNWTNRGGVKLGRDIGTDYSRNSRYKAHQFLDFNGDGLTDIAYVRNDRGSSTDYLYLIPNTGSGFGTEKRFNNLASKSFRKTWKVIDYDKDGKDDILYMPSGSSYWRVLKHTSAMNFSFTDLTAISKPSNDNNTRFMDIDADGYPELLHFVGNKLSYQKGTKTGLASGAAKAIKFNLSAPADSSATMLAYDKEDNTFQAMDFNGDGRADFLAKVQLSTYIEEPPCRNRFDCDVNPRSAPLASNQQISQSSLTTENQIEELHNNGDLNANDALIPLNSSQLNPVNMLASVEIPQQATLNDAQSIEGLVTTQRVSRTTYWKVLISKGNDTFDEFLTVGSTAGIKDIQVAELNGDGLADILYRDNNNKWYARINNGNGFNSAIYLFTYDKPSLKTVDINGDGVQEIYRENYGDYFHFYNGSGFTSRKLTDNRSDYNFSTYMDVTGDGTPDKLVFSGRMGLYQNSDAAATLITSVTDGFGAKTHVTYSTLNNRNVYVPHNDARSKNWGSGRVTDVKSGARVVSLLRKGGDQITYKYHGAKAQVGRGMLGFRQIEIESKNTGTKVVTTYRQDGDYRGSAERVQSYVRYGDDNGSGGGSGGGNPPGDPCEIIPELCNCKWGDRACEIPRTVPIADAEQFTMASGSKQMSSVNNFSASDLAKVATLSTATVNSNIWRLKSEIKTTYNRKQETAFKTANATVPYLVFPNRTETRSYNTDDSNQTVIATKIKTLAIDNFGNPITEAITVDSRNGYAHSSSTSTYSYSVYGGRLTRKAESKRYLNRLSGSNKGNYTNAHVSTFVYDGLGRLTKSIADNGVTKTYTLNSYGLISKETVSKAGLPTKTLHTYYDSTYRHVTGEENTLGHRSTIGYDGYGRKSYTQTANGQRTYYTYNKLGRLTGEISTPANNTSTSGSQALSNSKTKYWCKSTSHCPSNSVYYEETISEGSPASRSYFDVLGRPLREGSIVLNGNYVYVDYKYDSKGRKIQESMPFFANATPTWNTYQYDKQNRVVSVTKSDGSVWDTQYNGEEVTTINPSGHKNTQLKNAMGLLVKVIDANGKSATYQYDENGKSRILAGPKGNQIKVTFDKYGNKTQVIDPDKGTVNYSYNAYHQLSQESDSNGNLITYKYDTLGRVIESVRKRNNKLEHHTVTTYDSGSYAKGMVYTTSDKVSGFTERFYYDAFGRNREKHTIIDGDTYKELWAFNNNGQLLTETDATGKSVSYIYNSYKHLTSVKDNQTNATVWQAKAADAFGNITKEQLGSRITRNKVFDAHTGLLTSMVSTGSGTLQNLRYDWNNLGNLNYRQDLAVNKKETFGYDSLNRVTRSTISGGVTTDIRYNELGNITYKTGVGTYYYQSSRPHAVTQVTGSRPNNYQYDAAGNMVKDNDRELVYNSFHKPTYIKKDDYWVEFAYSGAGKRYKRSEFGGEKGSLIPILNGDITVFIPLAQETRYVGNVEFIRYGGQSAWVSKRYIAGKVLVTTVNNQATTRYMLDDHLGSTHVIADASGKLEQSMSFDVFGARRDAKTWARDFSDQAKFTSKITLRGFTGHEQMDEVGLVHMGGRIYDPILGRFLQADPMVQAPENIQNLNRYSYVVNNPLNKTDPSGYIFMTLAVWALQSAIASGIATGVAAGVISGMLTAYQFYGYAQFAISVAQAIDGGGTAMANFAGGYAKSWAKGQALNLAIAGMGMAINSIGKEQGAADTDSHSTKKGKYAAELLKQKVTVAGNVDDEVIVNESFRGVLKTDVSVSQKKYSIKLDLKVATKDLSEADLNEQVEFLKSSLKGKAKYNDRYEVEISANVSLAPDLENANLIINECPTPCSAGNVWDAAARAKVGSGNVIEMVPWRANETTGAHELGHLLGLSHQPENSGSIMSYDANKSFSQHNDLKRLFDAYRKTGFE